MYCLNSNFLVKESYTQALHSFPIIAFHIEVTPLADRTNEIIQEPDGDFSSEAQVNSAELTEITNLNLEEPQFTIPIDTTTGNIPIL